MQVHTKVPVALGATLLSGGVGWTNSDDAAEPAIIRENYVAFSAPDQFELPSDAWVPLKYSLNEPFGEIAGCSVDESGTAVFENDRPHREITFWCIGDSRHTTVCPAMGRNAFDVRVRRSQDGLWVVDLCEVPLP